MNLLGYFRAMTRYFIQDTAKQLPCKKEEKSVLVSMLNGSEWRADELSAFKSNDPGFISLTFRKVIGYGKHEYLAFTTLKPTLGTQTVVDLRAKLSPQDVFLRDTCSSFFKTIVDGHVDLEQYEVDLFQSDNYLIIDSYDEVSGRIKGRFQVTYINDDLHEENRLPERLEFKDGRFDLIVQ